MHNYLNLDLERWNINPDKTNELLMYNLKMREIEQIKVTINLIHLFEEIDVNGDENMEWDEFSNHIIELGLIKKDKDI